MVILFTVSKQEKENKQELFDKIIQLIEDEGHKVLSLEVQKYSDLLDIEKAEKKSSEVSIHNQYVKKALEMSDAAIFEGSRYSFKLGQEVQMALAKKVPVLMLSDEINYSESVQDPYFYTYMYKSVKDITSGLINFFEEVKKNHLSKRINVFLHNKHLNYLDWYVSEHKGANRSEHIRELIESAISSSDKYKER